MSDELYEAAAAWVNARLYGSSEPQVDTVVALENTVIAETTRRFKLEADLEADLEAGRAVRVRIVVGLDDDGDVWIGKRLVHSNYAPGIAALDLGSLSDEVSECDSAIPWSFVVPVPQPVEIEGTVESAGGES